MQRVDTPSGRTGWTLTTLGGVPVEPVDQFLRHRFNSEASPNTLRAYAHDLKHFFGFLAEQQLDWQRVTPGELGSFTAWLRRPAPNVLALPGAPPARAASSVSRAQSAVFSFYEFHRLQGVELASQLETCVRGRGGSYKPFLHGIAATKQRVRPGKLAVPSACRRRSRRCSSRRSSPLRHACAIGCCSRCSGFAGFASARRSACATRT